MVQWRDYFADWKRTLFPPATTTNLIQHYIPISGAVSHNLFSIHILAPTIISKTFPVYDLAVSNTILFNSHVGIGLYIFFRPHLYRLNYWDRVEFSVFSSVIFNFGSLLFAVLIKALLPKQLSTGLRVVVGSSLSIFLLSRGLKYTRHVDSRSSFIALINGKSNDKELLTR